MEERMPVDAEVAKLHHQLQTGSRELCGYDTYVHVRRITVLRTPTIAYYCGWSRLTTRLLPSPVRSPAARCNRCAVEDRRCSDYPQSPGSQNVVDQYSPASTPLDPDLSNKQLELYIIEGVS
jgi:hypothetical protein